MKGLNEKRDNIHREIDNLKMNNCITRLMTWRQTSKENTGKQELDTMSTKPKLTIHDTGRLYTLSNINFTLGGLLCSG